MIMIAIVILLFSFWICTSKGSELLFQLDLNECPPIPSKSNQFGVFAGYWRGDKKITFDRACNVLAQSKKRDPIIRAILSDLRDRTDYLIDLPDGHFTISDLPSQRSVVIPHVWELLGPFSVGKLEVDGDPTFDEYLSVFSLLNSDSQRDIDAMQYILGMEPENVVPSELVSGGTISWSIVKGDKSSGAVSVQFPHIAWNEVAQGASSFAAFEFQGWARTTTFVSDDGQYSIHCPGVHTLYIRNDDTTSILTGDVYRAGMIRGSVHLKRGPVGIALPLRGVGSTQYSCKLTLVTATSTPSVYVLDGARMLSNLLLLPTAGFVSIHGEINEKTDGLLLSPYFSIIIENPHHQPLNVSFNLRSPLTEKVKLRVALISESCVDSANYVTIESGQVMTVPLELYVVSSQAKSTSSWDGLLLPCSKGVSSFITVVIHTQGAQNTATMSPLEFTCRAIDQSFLLTYLDHDGTTSQAAVIFPLVDKARRIKHTPHHSVTFPVLLSLHGTGITPMNQADAYKQMSPPARDYSFGVRDYWVIAPSRHGAHNWEAVGALSAWTSVTSVQKFMSRINSFPQVTLHGGVIAGHSMGGHGAWMNAVNFPDFSGCISATAGWIRKEEYGGSNQFFELDISNSYVEPDLKALLELSMSEFHVDRLVRNMLGKVVHIRVGERDRTTHPWYSRRMLRLLRQHNISVSYEEVRGKEHWWWDTGVANDGGVLNDPVLRKFYSDCFNRSSTNYLSENRSDSGITSTCESGSIGQPLTLDVINPSSQTGRCGIRIIQQFHTMRLSTVEMSCSGISLRSKVCTLTTNGNVRRLSISLSKGAYAYGAISIQLLHANSPLISIDAASGRPAETSLDVCWKKSSPSEKSDGFDCSGLEFSLNPLKEKSVEASGSMRGVYTQQLVMVYGTFQIDSSRVKILRQLAVYHANSHTAAHNSFVRVMSDETYLNSEQSVFLSPHNVVFIGAMENRAMRELCMNTNNSQQRDTWNNNAIRCASPITFDFPTDECFAKSFDHLNPPLGHSSPSFRIGHMTFSKLDHSVVFTMPLTSNVEVSGGKAWSGVGACIYANSASAYLAMSRLSWPVVPPMVRSPMANYIPDYMVINNRLWSLGFGAVEIAGHWNATWQYDSEQSFTKIL